MPDGSRWGRYRKLIKTNDICYWPTLNCSLGTLGHVIGGGDELYLIVDTCYSLLMGDPSRTLGKKTGLPLHFHLWATFTVRQTFRIQFSNSAGVINNSGTELGQKIKVKYDMNDLVSYHLHWPPPTRTCGLRNSIFRALHMCIGADLNQDHFSRPRFSITHAKPWTLLFLSAPSFVFLLSWPPKKKKLFFSTVSLNGVGGGSSFERKKKQKKESMEIFVSLYWWLSEERSWLIF